MSSINSRKKKKRKTSLDSNDQHTSEVNSVNAYGVRYGPNLTVNGSRHRFSRSTNQVMSSNATVNLTRRGFNLRRSSGVNNEDEPLQGKSKSILINTRPVKSLDLLKQNWHIYSASAIYCFDYCPEKLTQYSKILNENIYTRANQPHNKVTYSSKFTYSPGCPARLCVKVYSNAKRQLRSNNNNFSSKLVYEGHFLSWDDKRVGINDENISPEDSSVFSMPLLLCKSSIGAAFVKNVHSCFVTIFDIVMSSVSLSQEDMAWLTCLASSDPDESQTDKAAAQEVNFFYDLPGPSLMKYEPHVAMSYELYLVHQIWKCVHQRDGVQDEVLYEEVLNFIRSFEEHSLCSYGVNLSECSLVKVVMPSTSFAIEGMIKMSSLVIAGRILRFLADMCALENTVVPSLGFSVSLRES